MVIELTLPSSSVFAKENISNIKPEGGIYFLYSLSNELLYIGKSTNIKVRVNNHIKGSSNTEEHAEEFNKVECFYIDNPLEIEIYETYLINTLKPKYNKNKIFIETEKKRNKKREYINQSEPPVDKQTLVKLRKTQSLTLSEMAKILNCSITTVLRYLKYYNIDKETQVEKMRKELIKNLKSLNTGECFKIEKLRKTDFFGMHFYKIIEEQEIKDILKDRKIYKIGGYYFRFNSNLTDQEVLSLKICTKCKRALNLSDFHKTGNRHVSKCKICRKNN
ncbi:nucleotide excision repair endonuclease [Bacillus albus]|uniref:nucleotide excision repair endonuclease n=1 Tax=Bacillus albus TaxID=2026189 RepID=UPI0018A1AC3D|nr:nucleotide excision repair endonuclease [Bacillus albus]MBF7155714.1 nucleotide excision repair endonuclease [Bacillus albus]